MVIISDFCRKVVVTISGFYNNTLQEETTNLTPHAKKLTVRVEDLMDGPTVLKADDTRLLEYIRKYFFLKPEHYEVRLEYRDEIYSLQIL